jgi:hypothetical protein
MKDKINEICNKLNREQLSIYGATNELFDLCVVSQQRELLEFFAEKWNDNQTTSETVIISQDIEEVIKNFNCG